MAKHKYFMVLFIIAIVLSCTNSLEKNDLINGKRVTEDGRTFIQWNGKKYESFGPLTFSLIRIQGNQVGILENDPKDKILKVKGYDSDEWIINYYDVIMTTYDLYKEENVEVIPEKLNKYRQKN